MTALRGKTVLVTRAAGRAAELSALLRRHGATPIEAPAIRIEPAPPDSGLDAAVARAAGGQVAWVVFTSGAAVEAWFSRSRALSVGPPRARIAAVGTGTAEALRSEGAEPDLVPATYTTDALGAAFPEGSGHVLMPRADIAPAELEETIRVKGWTPVRVDAYRTRPAGSLPDAARAAIESGGVDAVTFTSASTVDGFVRAAGVVLGAAVVCIGPVTADAARRAGFAVDEVAEPHTIEGLVDALERALARRDGRSHG